MDVLFADIREMLNFFRENNQSDFTGNLNDCFEDGWGIVSIILNVILLKFHEIDSLVTSLVHSTLIWREKYSFFGKNRDRVLVKVLIWRNFCFDELSFILNVKITDFFVSFLAKFSWKQRFRPEITKEVVWLNFLFQFQIKLMELEIEEMKNNEEKLREIKVVDMLRDELKRFQHEYDQMVKQGSGAGSGVAKRRHSV